MHSNLRKIQDDKRSRTVKKQIGSFVINFLNDETKNLELLLLKYKKMKDLKSLLPLLLMPLNKRLYFYFGFKNKVKGLKIKRKV